jgi:hypothetical protein
MTAYTVEVTEVTTVFVPHGSGAADAERQARDWIEAHASGEVRVSGEGVPVQRGREGEARLLADTAVEEA